MAGLKKQLGAQDVFSVAAGAMVSSGLFVLPYIAYKKAGPGIILSYLLASILMVPSVLSKAELSTAMPKAGGTYYFVERSFGPVFGLFSGMAGWFSLALKSAFAVVGMAIIVEIAMHELTGIKLSEGLLKSISVGCCVVFTILNIVSVKHTGHFQTWLVRILLGILLVFVFAGAGSIEVMRFDEFLKKGWISILATSGLVFVSYGGVTKVASIAEEVKQPGRNIPLGMILAWFVVSVFYVLVIGTTVGVVGDKLSESQVPIALASRKFMGTTGYILLNIAAAAAFITTANGGILAASRSPMAMSRDQLLPAVLSKLSNRFGTPYISILLTGGFMVTAIVLLDIEVLVKTASTLMLILFILANSSVIIMRESSIQSYRPLFKSPFYPYIHIAAIIAYLVLIIDMGAVPLLITVIFIVASTGWYFLYVAKRVTRAAAVMHIVERVTDKELKTVTLEDELRDILIERDEIIEDRFDKLVKNCEIIDIEEEKSWEQLFRQVSSLLAERMGLNEYVLFEKFLHREEEGGTVIEPGFAIPHIIVEGDNKFEIVLVRSRKGINFPSSAEPVKIMFVLAGSRDQRNYHLRALMAIAQIAQDKMFRQRWLDARDIENIRNLILLSRRKREPDE